MLVRSRRLRTTPRRAVAAAVTISCGPIAGSCQSRPTIRDAIGEAQKHRSSLSDLVSPKLRWEHRRSRGISRRATASVFPWRESEVGMTRASDVVHGSPAEAGHYVLSIAGARRRLPRWQSGGTRSDRGRCRALPHRRASRAAAPATSRSGSAVAGSECRR
jgi:hypothetical protein